MKSKNIEAARTLRIRISKLLSTLIVLKSGSFREVRFRGPSATACLHNVGDKSQEPFSVISKKMGGVIQLLVIDDLNEAIKAKKAELKELGVDYDEETEA